MMRHLLVRVRYITRLGGKAKIRRVRQADFDLEAGDPFVRFTILQLELTRQLDKPS